MLAISPDGTHLAYPSDEGLLLRPLAAPVAELLRGTESGSAPFFSPDGRWVGFWQLSGVRRVSVAGGAPVPMAELPLLSGAWWDANDSVLLGGGAAGILRVSSNGGVMETVATVDAGQRAASPQLLPGGTWVLFTLRPRGATSWDDSQIVVQSIETGERLPLISGGRSGRYVPTGHLVYALGETLLAVPFDVETLTVSASPTSMIEDLDATVLIPFGVADDGTLAYLRGRGPGAEGSELGWVDSDGQMSPLVQESGGYRAPRLSPNGRRLAVRMTGDTLDLWLYDIERGTMSRLTEGGANSNAAWSPDGTAITFASDRSGSFDLYERAVDRSGEATRPLQTSTGAFPGSWAPRWQRVGLLPGHRSR